MQGKELLIQTDSDTRLSLDYFFPNTEMYSITGKNTWLSQLCFNPYSTDWGTCRPKKYTFCHISQMLYFVIPFMICQ